MVAGVEIGERRGAARRYLAVVAAGVGRLVAFARHHGLRQPPEFLRPGVRRRATGILRHLLKALGDMRVRMVRPLPVGAPVAIVGVGAGIAAPGVVDTAKLVEAVAGVIPPGDLGLNVRSVSASLPSEALSWRVVSRLRAS